MGKMKEGEIKLDDKDMELLWILVENSRLPLKELAKKTGLTIDSVFRRIKFMENSGVISKYTIGISLKRIGYNIVAYVEIRLKSISEKELQGFIDYLSDEKRVSRITSTMGDYDLIITIMAKDNAEFEKVSNSIRHKFKEIIDEWKSIPIMKYYKYNYVKVKN
jgi:DNA-binding Lrp family transcriptional regulator